MGDGDEGVYVGPIEHQPSQCVPGACGPEFPYGCWCSACQHGHHDPKGCWPEPPREWDDTTRAGSVLDDIYHHLSVWQQSRNDPMGISTGEAMRNVRRLMRRLPEGGGVL